MGQRTQWRFGYAALQVAAGARKKAAHHRARQAWWTDQKAEAEAQMKAATVQLTEFPVTGGTRVEVKIDPTLTTRYDECAGKIRQHQMSAEDYERWASVLEANGDEQLQLDPDDIHYFALSAHAELPT